MGDEGVDEVVSYAWLIHAIGAVGKDGFCLSDMSESLSLSLSPAVERKK